jgi:hypothetical protein
VGMSRSGKARESATESLPNVSYMQGNCLEPETFKAALEDVDSVVHTVGTLLPSAKPHLSYAAMNRDAAINMARELNAFGTQRQFVHLGSEKAPAFLSAYLSAKLEAEKFIQEECEHIKPCLLHPGFIVDKEHRGWSVPLGKACDLFWWYNEKTYKKIPMLGAQVDFLFPAKSI